MGAFWGENGVTPGCLYDLTLRGTDNDQLTIFSPSKQQGRVSYVKIGENGKSVETHVSAALSGGLTKTHIYALEDDQSGLTITSILKNGTKEKISGPINDSWTRFRESSRMGVVEWADSVDPHINAAMPTYGSRRKTVKLHPRPKPFNPAQRLS